jgi:diguanylate cyclase (GGDEF)-like protein
VNLARNSSSRRQLILIGLCLIVIATGAVIVIGTPTEGEWRFVRYIAWAMPTVAAAIILRRLRDSQSAHLSAQRAMALRSHTLDRLLDFSQTIQGAGRAEQIFASLGHFLRTELGLSGLLIVTHEPDSTPTTCVKEISGSSLRSDTGVNAAAYELDPMLCPCLRQHLPRTFKPDAPVRCAIDSMLTLPADQPAYCVPFTVGRKTNVLVHMMLPADSEWTEEQKQLAQTYINAASSALITLHHLSEAEKQSLTDSLTGLYNRRSMDQLLQREVALAERHNLPLSIVMLDMDRFKDINDTHGHAAGDHMLRAFADCVRITLRKTDLAFRYGGDEFVIALPQTPIHQAQQVVNKVRQAFLSVDFSDAIAHLERQPTLSIGLAERSAALNVLTLPQLLTAADAALYDAKKSDRDCVKVYAPPQAA